MRKHRIFPAYQNVEIFDIATEGRGVGKIDELIVFVKHAIPGDIVDIQLTKKKSSFGEANVTNYVKKSSDRIDAFCEHFGTCGGCKWQHLSYTQQLYYKQKQVNDNFTRIAKIEIPEIKPILASGNVTLYRNKLEYTFSNKRWLTSEEIGSIDNYENMEGLGFHIPGRFDKVLDINKCYLQTDPSNDIRQEVRKFCLDNGISFFDIRQQKGIMRNIIIRTTSTKQLMIILSITERNEKIDSLLDFLDKRFPEITSLNYTINTKGNDTISDLEIVCFKGEEYIMEAMEDLKFRIGPKSFYQTNSEQAYQLYSVAREFAGITENDTVYDLYTGTGTIANFVARKAKQVIGIEYVPEAIEDAKINSQINNISNTQFFAGDMAKVLNDDFCKTYGNPDIVITDPPRAGMHTDVIDMLIKINAKKIVYVSCNPATQARDVALLADYYKVTKIQPVDMFPHTEHVENVILMERK
ncbi:MAG: 23S rRNA (uracil(1939)-C(5))-methyltransferase RlmD [Bacteroidota bacterium]